MKLSILICHLYSRHNFLHELLIAISRQDKVCLDQAEMLINADAGVKSIGQKRNELLAAAKGEYVVFIDDDDIISPDYLTRIFKGISAQVDHIGISMTYQEDGGPESMVRCSMLHDTWGSENGVYLRTAQHVCPIKREIAIQVKYPDSSFGEDKEYSLQVNKLIHNEHLIEEPIYFYKYRKNKTA